MLQPKIVILELGSQHTLQIQRCLREIGHPSVILSVEEAVAWLETNHVECVIGSGGMKSVYEDGAPRVPFRTIFKKRIPYLGICFGMQSLAHAHGGVVERGRPEYARATISLDKSRLFFNLDPEQDVWMSHGDSVTVSPRGYKVIARSVATGLIAAIEHKHYRGCYGVQFHPEVSHTPHGKTILKNFVEHCASCEPQCEQISQIETMQTMLAESVGGARAIIGFSGGVDSTTLAKIAGGILGERLLAITIDGGHLRENEIEEIKLHAECAGVHLKVIDPSDEMVSAIGKTTDSEEKRKIFSGIYERIFAEEARAFGGGDVVILQATLAPDRIESGKTGGATIKSHHNVGLCFGGLRQLHPFGHLYKDEVRKLARELGLPKSVFDRPPFPGPGNFLRVVNIPATRENLSVVQWAEARTREILKESTYHGISQLVVAVLGRATGVKGDGPVYGYIIGVRGVRTKDFMTAEGVEFDPETQCTIKTKLGEHPLITQVGFFPMDKPPGTTEFE